MSNFIVRAKGQYLLANTLVEALDLKGEYGGCIYEPMGADVARQVCTIEDQQQEIERLNARIHDLEAYGGIPDVVKENAATVENNRAMQQKIEWLKAALVKAAKHAEPDLYNYLIEEGGD